MEDYITKIPEILKEECDGGERAPSREKGEGEDRLHFGAGQLGSQARTIRPVLWGVALSTIGGQPDYERGHGMDGQVGQAVPRKDVVEVKVDKAGLRPQGGHRHFGKRCGLCCSAQGAFPGRRHVRILAQPGQVLGGGGAGQRCSRRRA